MQLYLVEALDNYGIYDDLSTVPRNTFWQALASGFDVTLNPGQTRQFTASIAIDDESWQHFADVRFIAWAQAPALVGPAEVYNATQLPLPPLIQGDYSRNGVVDAADYIVWRNTHGQSGTGLLADGNGDTFVNNADYNLWRAHFGQVAASGATANVAVPEPATFALLIIAAAHRRRRRRLTTMCITSK